jgi:cyclopropane fatty-acyl-phospholipid synthase-like methyltransferase
MSDIDWESRYQSGDTPWEKGEPSPGLVDFLNANLQMDRGSVAIPGCGSGNDAIAWAEAGFEAWGFDLAPSAVRSAKERAAATGLAISVVQSDFLAAAPPKPFDWLFEHSLYCAIDPDRRCDYVEAALRWLKPNGQILAVHYMIRDMEGPPFGTTQEELMERFSPHFELVQGWVPRSYLNRAGLELMLWWRRKGVKSG